MKLHPRFSVKSIISSVFTLTLMLFTITSSLGSWGQAPGPGGPQDYYNTIGARPTRPQEEQQVTVLIKQGKKIYCAWQNVPLLLHNDVQFLEVLPEEAEKFYDDGTHNDEVPFDGLPSNVEIINDQYISPYAVAIKEKLGAFKDKMLTMEESEFMNVSEWMDYEKDNWDPLRFYAGFKVASLDEKTILPRYVDKLEEMVTEFEIFDQDVIEQFRGYEYYSDEENPAMERELWSRIDPQNPKIRKKFKVDQRQRQQDFGLQGGSPYGAYLDRFEGGGGGPRR